MKENDERKKITVNSLLSSLKDDPSAVNDNCARQPIKKKKIANVEDNAFISRK